MQKIAAIAVSLAILITMLLAINALIPGALTQIWNWFLQQVGIA